MRFSTIIIIIVALCIIVPSSALIAADSAQYHTNISVVNGVAYGETANGMVNLDKVHENSTPLVSVKAMPINVLPQNAPSTLPNTSSAHGDYTCTMHNHGVDFTVTNNTPCNER